MSMVKIETLEEARKLTFRRNLDEVKNSHGMMPSGEAHECNLGSLSFINPHDAPVLPGKYKETEAYKIMEYVVSQQPPIRMVPWSEVKKSISSTKSTP